MIAIIDYGLGNSVSVQNMIRKVGGEAIITSERNQIAEAQKIILPGVGHFTKGIENLKAKGIDETLKTLAKEGRMILGICLGAQLLSNHSEEGNADGLGLIPIETKKFEFNSSELKVPHMGWNQISLKNHHVLFENLNLESRFYFVHSFFMECTNSEYVIAESIYGHTFASVVGKDNVIGMQFHPEKSHKFGMQLMKNFVNL